ncbi:hypothetical protein HPP92_020233 [Vanilla planifolia]|uniref:Uncharacterized protein n=1 Tax=Vanilla planifolia TaxID=51239 RepID=A0A835UI85_VANPL|nr:hypothetical protein HPP92_020643 [Vanilla planifolia]KAG0461757.1 hypothetical protein HPP92_020233 [Vanilla planifolia]
MDMRSSIVEVLQRYDGVIQEDEREEGFDDEPDPNIASAPPYRHEPTPLHPAAKPASCPTRGADGILQNLSVSCNKCRPSSRGKISVVPVESNGSKRPSDDHRSIVSSGLFRSIFGTIALKSPLHASSAKGQSSKEWKIMAAELSRKLLVAVRKRDEALLEASRLKNSVSELERKLDMLENYCRDLRVAINRYDTGPVHFVHMEPFVTAVADARVAVRKLSRCLQNQLRAAPRSLHRVASLLLSSGLDRKKPANLLIGMESLLNQVFYSDFERAGYEEGLLADPAARCAASRAAYESVRELGWEEVLSRGTRHYSKGLSRFCDRRMSEVVGILGWGRVWPEELLQAFFVAARGAWAVHQLARSVHPAVPILRVDRGARFDPVYMENSAVGSEAGLDAGKDQPSAALVSLMVAPGFYVQSAGCGLVKCRVIVAFGVNRGSGRNGPEEC